MTSKENEAVIIQGDDLQKFKDDLATELFGETKESAVAAGRCIDCKEEALPKCYSDAGRREYNISGLCEVCWDRIMGGGE